MMRVGGDRSGNAAHEPGEVAAELGGDQLKAAVRGGAFATLATQVVGQLAQLAILALLYRLVSPSEFGLFGLAVPILMFLRLFASAGLHVATVGQADLTRDQLGAIFWLNLAAGLATTVVTVLAAPLIARAYDVADLHRLLWVLAATSLAGALAAQQQAVLERRLQFRQLSYYRIVAMLLGGTVAILLAWRGDGVAALVGQMYAELLVLILLCSRAGGWPQGRPSFVGASRFVRFGGLFMLSSLVFYLVQYGDKLLLGWLVGDRWPAQVGYYTQAFNWTMKPVFLLTTPLSGVALAGLARAGADVAARTSLVFAFNRLAALLLLPVGVGLMIVAPEAIAVVGGEAWLPAREILRILAATILVQAFVNLCGSLLAATGRAAELLRLSCVFTAWMLLAFAVGLAWGHQYDRPALGLAWGYSLGLLVAFVPFLNYSLRAAGIAPPAWFANLRAAAQATLAMGAIVLAYHLAWIAWVDAPPALLLASEVALGIASYAWFARRELAWLRSQLAQLRG